MIQLTLEGTWEEIARQAEKLAGKRVRLTILGDEWNGEASGDALCKERQMFFGMFRGDVEPTDEDFRSAEFHGDPDDGLDWT